MADAPGANLHDQLVARIRRDGPVSFADYVDAALYDWRCGFFSRGGGAGRRADFITSPEVGPLFGAVIANALDRWWQEAGAPETFTFVDCGAGPGTLARSLLAARPQCLDALRIVLVERAVALHTRHPAGPGIESMDQLPDAVIDHAGVVFANELLDNLPFELHGPDGPILVDVNEHGGLQFAPPLGPGAWARQTYATAWLSRARALIRHGRVVIIDYATTTASMRSRPWNEWMRTYRGHDRGGHPLDHPGQQDITVDVALDQLAAVAPPANDRSQAEFLRAHGIDELVDEGRRIWEQRAHIGDLAALTARSRIRERDALCDPTGLGAFRVVEWMPRAPTET